MAGEDRILIRSGDGAWESPSLTGYADETALQAILAEHPELLPGVDEPAVACTEFESGVGPADVVVITDEGRLELVECKLARNRQVRREVIGQVLDYSSRIWSMSIDDFETRWRARTGESAFEVFGVDASAVRSGVESALRDGSFTLVLAVDAINDDLRRIVEYLNAITRDDVSILAFEATRFAHGRVEILMPRVYGAELVAMKDRRRRTNSWTPQEFLTAAGNDGDEVAVAAGLFLDEVRAAGFTLFNGTATHPNVIIGRPDDGYWPVSLYSNPVRPRIRLHDITDARGPELATACASRLIGIPGAKLDPEKPNIRAKLTLTSEALTDPSQRARFFDAMKLLAQGVHKGDAGAS